MEILKLLPILFLAAQGEARAIHQQLLPAIPGYVPVYIQQGPDVQVIYETGRKVTVNEVVKDAVEEVQKEKLVEGQKQTMDESIQQPSQDVVEAKPEEPVKAGEESSQAPEEKEPAEVQKQDPENPNSIKDSEIKDDSSKKNGIGSVVLVPGYQSSP